MREVFEMEPIMRVVDNKLVIDCQDEKQASDLMKGLKTAFKNKMVRKLLGV